MSIIRHTTNNVVFINSSKNVPYITVLEGLPHPLRKYPNRTTLKKVDTTLRKYFLFSMRSILNSIVGLIQL